MSLNSKKRMLINEEISVFDLTPEEVAKMKKSFEKDLQNKKQELKEINQKIRNMKTRIDNWAN
ncbi:MAG: hypothetical protein IJ867_03060 [Clostridia bacterium]|nr:hypothetical protein [Clostridia bacterium]